MKLEFLLPLLLAAALFPVSFFVGRIPAQWRRAGLWTLSIFFLAYGLLDAETRMFSIVLACVAAALAARPAGSKPA